uniref:Diphthine synthase n=1 Tax=Caldiarchaeum subterraneum TaxID=311458 RepID=E6NBJ0_CALS0|nr:diphthine synthase [Candidatus Caldarchaeum subterraneum]
MVLTFVGGGLGRFEHLTIEALETVKNAEKIYVDTYTSFWAADFFDKLREAAGHVVAADRKMLEDNVHKLVSEAVENEIVLLTPGDPFIATTHLAIRTLAHRKNVSVKVVHGVSAVSAAVSSSGLHIYKFGKTATIPKTTDSNMLNEIFKTIETNLSNNLHTLLLLDTSDHGLTIPEAVKQLLDYSKQHGKSFINQNTLMMALARLGFPDNMTLAAPAEKLMIHNFPPPPHSIIIPSNLHFTEEEILQTFHKGPLCIAENPLKSRVMNYVVKCRIILADLSDFHELTDYLGYVSRYVEDAERFVKDGNMVDALLAIGYAEGLLDALRLRGEVTFTW